MGEVYTYEAKWMQEIERHLGGRESSILKQDERKKLLRDMPPPTFRPPLSRKVSHRPSWMYCSVMWCKVSQFYLSVNRKIASQLPLIIVKTVVHHVPALPASNYNGRDLFHFISFHFISFHFILSSSSSSSSSLSSSWTSSSTILKYIILLLSPSLFGVSCRDINRCVCFV